MSRPYMRVGRLSRHLSNGGFEHLQFSAGVNLLIGRPNTGKTKWLQTLDYLLGDPDSNPFEAATEEGLATKYQAASMELFFDENHKLIERRWREPGARTKVFVDQVGVTPRDLQHVIMNETGIPVLSFPKGNPMSGQTWPELSFRMLLRHIHRQQRFWTNIADQQPEGEQHACLLQFLGLAERLYTDDYGELIELKIQIDKLKARREQFLQTLNELAIELIADTNISVSVTTESVRAAQGRIAKEMEDLLHSRTEFLSGVRDNAIPSSSRDIVTRLGSERAKIIAELEGLEKSANSLADRAHEIETYRSDLDNEADRLKRAQESATILADLRITHCPACDQTVKETSKGNVCFLCSQQLPDEPRVSDLGAVRLAFEQNRLTAEVAEARELLDTLQQRSKEVAGQIAYCQERFQTIESQLAPVRDAVSSLVHSEVSGIDMRLGELTAQQRQLRRIAAALELSGSLSRQIAELERKVEPLQHKVEEIAQTADFDRAATALEDGMNAYLSALNALRPNVWRHSPIEIDLSRYSFSMRVGKRRWQAALGGTDSLYFLMAYHYGLLSLSRKEECHYPGLSIIDVPADFAGEAIEDKENFIVQPFIDLLARPEFQGAQLIVSGASFAGLEAATRIHLRDVHVS